MALSSTVLRYITLGVTFIAALFAVLATAGNSWLSIDQVNLGLWKYCGLDGDCKDMFENDSLKATQALMVITCLCYGFAFGYLILIHFCVKNLSIKFLAAILFVTCIMEVSGLSVYTDNNETSAEFSYGWSYALGWCSAILTLIAGVLCFFDDGYSQLE